MVLIYKNFGWEEGGTAWQWCPRLRAWEEELLECRILLYDISLQNNSADYWQWRLDPRNIYSVRSVYQKLTSQEFLSFDGTSDFIWHKQVPLKVSIMAWRLLRNRLPTKDNLVARGIISHEISCARLVVEALRLLIIYSSLAPVSVDCGSCSGVDWYLIGWSVPFTRSSFSVRLFFRGRARSVFFFAACLVMLCLGLVEWK